MHLLYYPIQSNIFMSESELIPYPITNDNPLRTETHFLEQLQLNDDDESSDKRFVELQNLLYDNSMGAFETLLYNTETERSFVDQVDTGGQTLLHLASFWNRPDAVQLLIDLGANIDITNVEDRLPIDIAVDWKHDECAELLRAAGGRSTLEETIHTLQTKNMALLRSLDLERRKVQQTEKNYQQKNQECLIVQNERDEAIYSSQKNLQRAEIAEKGTSVLIENLKNMTKLKDVWKNTSQKQSIEIAAYRKKIVDLALNLKTALVKTHSFRIKCAKAERKLTRCQLRLNNKNSKLILLEIKYQASKLKLILLSKELRARDIEVVRLSEIEKKAKKLQRALQNFKAQTLMEALHALVPIEILTGSFRTLQSLARAGSKAHDYYGGKDVKNPAKKKYGRRNGNGSNGNNRNGKNRNGYGNRKTNRKRIRPATAHSSLSTSSTSKTSNFSMGTSNISSTSTSASSTNSIAEQRAKEWRIKQGLEATTITSKEILDPAKELLWKGTPQDNSKSRLMGNIDLPFPLLAVTPGGCCCIVVTKAIYDPITETESLIIVNGVSNDDLMADEELAPALDENELKEKEPNIFEGRWSKLAEMNTAGSNESKKETKKKRIPLFPEIEKRKIYKKPLPLDQLDLVDT